MGGGESSPNALDKNIQNAKLVRVGEVAGEQHYKSGACVSDECESVFGVSGAGVCEHAYEGAEPCVLPQH